jgi:hypothetical protein
MGVDEEKDRAQKTGEYLERVLRGPTSADHELMMLVDDFMRFLTLQIFRQMISGMTKQSREAICEEIISNWCRRVRGHTNEVVKCHEQAIQTAGSELVNSLGDGESMRLQTNKRMTGAVEIIRRWFVGVNDGLPQT